MIKSIVREFHWKPSTIESLYLDDADFFGLEYWYNDVVDIQNEIKKNSKK